MADYSELHLSEMADYSELHPSEMADYSELHLSENLNKYFNDFGYSEERLKARWRANDKVSEAVKISYRQMYNEPTVDKFLVGSQREGISLYGESDSDWMYVDKNVLCLENPNTRYADDRPVALFTMDRSKACPGYTYLKFNHKSRVDSEYSNKLRPALVETEGGTYLSTSKFMAAIDHITRSGPGWGSKHEVYRPQHGPSIPKYVKDWNFIENLMDDINFCRDTDNVIGFECIYPSLIQNWVDRKRGQAWPSESVINAIRDSKVYVVPVGSNDSEDDLEWRISFVEAEIHLIRSFNDTQRKMLVSLRHIAKKWLKHVIPWMSSYIMKQVALWMADRTATEEWVPDNLWEMIIKAITFLIERINDKNLENYMMLGTNIMEGKFEDRERDEIISFMHMTLSRLTVIHYRRSSSSRNFLEENDSLNYLDWMHAAKCELFSTETLANLLVWSSQSEHRIMLLFYTAMLHIWFCIRRFPSLVWFQFTQGRMKNPLKPHLLEASWFILGLRHFSGDSKCLLLLVTCSVCVLKFLVELCTNDP